MVPVVVLVLVAVALVAAVLGVANGRLPADPLADAVRSTPDPGLPEQPEAADVDAVRFDTALRGYRMDEVDARLSALRDDLADRERTLARLRAQGLPRGPRAGEGVSFIVTRRTHLAPEVAWSALTDLPVAAIGEPLRYAVAAELQRFIMDAFAPGPKIALAALGEDAVPAGALVLAGSSPKRRC